MCGLTVSIDKRMHALPLADQTIIGHVYDRFRSTNSSWNPFEIPHNMKEKRDS
jgi:hypothetical protein